MMGIFDDATTTTTGIYVAAVTADAVIAGAGNGAVSS
jgi:hypothetical protein